MLNTVLELILDEKRLNMFFLVLLFAGPPVCILSGYIIGKIRKTERSSLIIGIICGVFTALVAILWQVYNLIMNHYGLDSVKALLINVFLFLSIGVLTGLCLRKINSREQLFPDN